MQELKADRINIDEITATHEAAHCVVAYIFGRTTRRASVGQEGSGAVITMKLRPDARRRMGEQKFRELAIEEIKIAMAGPAGEHIQMSTVDAVACAGDYQNAERWLRELNQADDLARAKFWFATRRLLREPRTWAAVRAIAGRLLESGELAGFELAAICRSAKVPRAAEN